MAEVELWDRPGDADAWREVRAPGGYEWWYFDAEADAGQTRIVVILLDGFVFHPQYLRRDAAYRRHPTRHAPAFAREYPCVYLAVYEAGRRVAQVMEQFPAGSLIAAKGSPSVQIGPNSLRWRDGGYDVRAGGQAWAITGRGPRQQGDHIAVSLRFEGPRLDIERPFFSHAMTGEEHRWIVAMPAAHVRGEVTLNGPRGERRIKVEGNGYHDHNFGTGSIGPGLHRWLWGRALFGGDGDRAVVFHGAQGERGQEEAEVVADGNPMAGSKVAWGRGGRRSAWGLQYPRSVDVTWEVGHLRLTDARVVDSAPFYLRLVYRAEWEGQVGEAFCEIAYPGRLRWPVLGRMVDMSIFPAAAATGAE